MDRKVLRIIEIFPGLRDDNNFCLTSPETSDYNCISWALRKKNCWMWPNTDNHICDADEFWPEGVPNEDSLHCFISAYEKFGFEITENGLLEKEYEKIALYVSFYTNKVTHAARQLANGLWTSKLSYWEDIQHTSPHSLEGNFYGTVQCFMRRKRD